MANKRDEQVPADDQLTKNLGTDPTATDHPVGEDQARENAENEPPG